MSLKPNSKRINTFNANATKRIYPKGISSSAFKRAWNEVFTGKDVIVAIIDTGIDSSHPDLRGKIIKSINLTGESINESQRNTCRRNNSLHWLINWGSPRRISYRYLSTRKKWRFCKSNFISYS